MGYRHKENCADIQRPPRVSPRGCFRPAGQRIAILNDDSIMQTIDPTNGNVDRTFAGHAESRIAYSPDGKFMVSGGEENTVQLWDADSGKLLRTLTGHTDSVFAAAFSPDGRDRN